MKLDDKEAAAEYMRGWDARRPSWVAHQRLRDSMYGIRVEDDPHVHHAASFAVCCPEHGWIGDDLTIALARSLRDEHESAHTPAVQGATP